MNNTSTTATNSIATETEANIIATTEPNCTATRTTATYYCNNSNIYSTGTVTMDTFMYTIKGAEHQRQTNTPVTRGTITNTI